MLSQKDKKNLNQNLRAKTKRRKINLTVTMKKLLKCEKCVKRMKEMITVMIITNKVMTYLWSGRIKLIQEDKFGFSEQNFFMEISWHLRVTDILEKKQVFDIKARWNIRIQNVNVSDLLTTTCILLLETQPNMRLHYKNFFLYLPLKDGEYTHFVIMFTTPKRKLQRF